MARTVSEEAAFQTRIRREAERTGWHIPRGQLDDMNEQLVALRQPPMELPGLWFHAMIAYRSEPGWPDVFLARALDRRILFAELKTDKPTSKLSARQLQVLGLLERIACRPRDLLAPHGVPEDVLAQLVTVEVHVWRPRDWDAVVDALR